MKNTVALLVAVSLTACAGRTPPPEPIIKIVEVVVPGPSVPCVPKALTGPPIYVDTDDALRAARDAAERFQLLFGGRMQRVARLNEVEPIVASCPKQ